MGMWYKRQFIEKIFNNSSSLVLEKLHSMNVLFLIFNFSFLAYKVSIINYFLYNWAYNYMQ